jgi:hypothetical protein
MEVPTVVQKNYEFLKYLIPVLSKFPRDQKYLLADKIELLFLDVLDNLLTAYYAKPGLQKIETLAKTNLLLEKSRFLIRLSYDLKYISPKAYENCAKRIN